ncbi:MAG: DNA methyltransferase [Gammaproteobacteria bacterium]|nr:DNA methyltransferase [Gammaproteobacteria bacterium]
MSTSILTSEEGKCTAYREKYAPTVARHVTCDTPLKDISLNWTEKQLPERERTKHVHRLHPYLGKYIPQLVEVFLRKYFKPSMTVLDPFSGSGTTLIQANELEINSVGCDISAFNILLGSVKTATYNVSQLNKEVTDILGKTALLAGHEAPLLPVDELPEVNLQVDNAYLKEWFAPQALEELLIFRSLIPNYEHQDFLKLVLSRAARSARRTTHFDLDFPKKPVTEPYFCHKHGRTCTPTETAFKFLTRYGRDNFRRVEEFSKIRTSAKVKLVHGDSRIAKFPQADGVITSPPYVGLIDYHEQHRYAFELLNLPDNRGDEIGSAEEGQSKAAKEAYVANMKAVFQNVSRKIRVGGRLIVVAGDRHNVYSEILDEPNLAHEATLQRHVNRRTGRRSGEFYESIFIYVKK